MSMSIRPMLTAAANLTVYGVTLVVSFGIVAGAARLAYMIVTWRL